MALRKLTQYAVLAPFQPPVAGIPQRTYCITKLPATAGGGPGPNGGPPNPPNNSGTPPPCPVTIFVPPCVPSGSLTVGGPEVCTPRTINC